jgi:L-serine/L-threonine ammonia-lyase
MAADGLYIETPLIESLALGRAVGGRVWLKMEAAQPCGSFKARGIGFACRRYREQGCRGFVSASGGNAGLAVAYAGRRLGVPAVVVVPESTGERARDLIRQESARVVVHGRSWQEAHEHALQLAADGLPYIHPFDDPLVWEGNATLVDEVAAAGLVPDAVVLSVGGGGLLCGVAHGMARAGWSDVPILTSETLGAESFYKSVRANALIELPEITSIATTLGAKRVSARALEWSRERPILAHTVSDREAVEACLRFADDHRVVVEPACGASLALVYQAAEALRGKKDILVVVCGGAGVGYRDLLKFREMAA